MRRIPPSLFSLILLLCPLAASAHDTNPAEWCRDPELLPAIVARFAFTEAELYENAERFEASHDHSGKPDGTSLIDGKCGIVDRWSWSDVLAHEFCAEAAPEAQAMPLVLSPQSFLDSNHHDHYKFRDGLSGVCVVCM